MLTTSQFVRPNGFGSRATTVSDRCRLRASAGLPFIQRSISSGFVRITGMALPSHCEPSSGIRQTRRDDPTQPSIGDVGALELPVSVSLEMERGTRGLLRVAAIDRVPDVE